ncbi:CobW/HypB/UreG, nucleotide-binding domain-containing protein [Infundibulicybe gibba]|nr:CobW/HypB/UreG, nucleotide-binding domain-containing protein [Infundibulicybe gibba]
MASPPSIPITVFTGFLGAGKTSVILSLLPQLPKDYKVVLLKNEFGDIEVDSKLARESNLAAVSEILNGCMCCVLVGQMQTALLEIRDKFRPDRIIIECSGSAFPATLAFQIRQLERDTSGDLTLDAIITVIDAENFAGYEDISPTAKMQASYTDIILINKWEHVPEHSLDTVLDHLHTLNDLTPKIKCRGRAGVDPNLIFNLQSKLFLNPSEPMPTHNDEVETLTITSRTSEASSLTQSPPSLVSRETLLTALATLSKTSIWRVKGFVHLSVVGEAADDTQYILNWAFGRYDLVKYLPQEKSGPGADAVVGIHLTVMGERGEVRRATRNFVVALGEGVRVA